MIFDNVKVGINQATITIRSQLRMFLEKLERVTSMQLRFLTREELELLLRWLDFLKEPLMLLFPISFKESNLDLLLEIFK